MTAITVRELIAELAEVDLDLPVYLQIDQEGNGYHTVRGVEAGMTDLEEQRPDSITPPDAAENPKEWDLEPGEYKTNCVVVYP